NHYHDDNVSGHPLGEGEPAAVVPTEAPKSSPFVGSEYVSFPSRDLPRTAMGWEVNPQGLRVLLNRLRDEYEGLPALYITENGASYADELSADGVVADVERREYVFSHLDAVAGAIQDGVDVRGYFLWSLLDNFEWAWGYQKRFGIIYVDYETQERIVKDSGRAYAGLIAANRTMA
ncbi:MAG: family 1 glycosylhydrolase, partial [Glutamicibacter sp.]